METPKYRIAVDAGGTFADCVVMDSDGAVWSYKSPTTPPDLTVGIMNAVRGAAHNLGMQDESELLGLTTSFVHGSTVATNIMIERKGAVTGLLTTRGHEDAIRIGRGRQAVAGLSESQVTHVTHHSKPRALVARPNIIGLVERVDSDGDVLVPLEAGAVRSALDSLVSNGVKSVACCFLWSFRNPVHEELVRTIMADEYADLFVSISSDVAPTMGEYERVTSTVINAYIGPALAQYVNILQTALEARGLRVPALYTQANGGVTTLDHAKERPLVTLDAGPAAGVLGVAALSGEFAQDNILCADVGGTSFDVGVVSRGHAEYDDYPVIDQYEFRLPKVLIDSIGAGGGSIAWLDSRNVLRVGPDSAGASPGPACYGRGGERATVTDAFLVLGYLDPHVPLASGIQPDLGAARSVLSTLGKSVEWTVEEVAAAIVRISSNQMADLLHRVTMERGLDPRAFGLVVYGGAGPLYGAAIAEASGIGVVYIMPQAGAFSALGMLMTDMVSSTEASFVHRLPLARATEDEFWREVDRLEGVVGDFFTAQGMMDQGPEIRRSARLRFIGQAHDLEVPLHPDDRDTDKDVGSLLEDRFRARFRSVYGDNSIYEAASVELVEIRTAGIDSVGTTLGDSTAMAVDAPGTSTSAPTTRAVFFVEHGVVESAIFDDVRSSLPSTIDGPAIVHRAGDTIAVPPNWTARFQSSGQVTLEKRAV